MRKVPATQQPLVIDLTDDENPLDGQDRMEAHLHSDDYFEVLNLPRSASASDVKRAYRKLAVQWHPDKNRSNLHAEGIFKRIGEAYEVLSDPEKRQIYVKYGKAGLNGGAAAAENADGYPRRGHGGFSTQHARDIFDAFFGGQDPFEAFFGQHRGSTQRYGRSEHDVFGSMGFGRMGIGHGFGNMGMPGSGFGNMGMDVFFSDGFGGMAGSGVGFSTSTSSSSSTFTDRNGHVITQKTVTTTGADGRTSTTTQEFRNGTLVNSSSTCDSRLADAGRMQLEGGGLNGSMSYQRRGTRPRY